MNRFLISLLCACMLPHLCGGADSATPDAALDSDLAALDKWYAARLKGITGAMKKRLSAANSRYRTQLNVLLRKKKAAGDTKYAGEIEAELERLAEGKPTSDPAKHAKSHPEISEAVVARLRSERKARILDAGDTTALGDQILAVLKRTELNQSKKGNTEEAARVRARMKEITGQAELKAARQRAENYETEARKLEEKARREKFLQDLVAGRLGPFAPRAPDAAWRPRLDLAAAWKRMQEMDCDYSVFEYFSGRSVAQLLPEISRKPDQERVRYLLYMLFNRLDTKVAVAQLKSFPPELVMDSIRTSFWPEELYPLKADGPHLWAAWASYVREGRAHGLIQLGVKKQKDKNEIREIRSFRAASIPEKGWQSVPASSYLVEKAEGH